MVDIFYHFICYVDTLHSSEKFIFFAGSADKNLLATLKLLNQTYHFDISEMRKAMDNSVQQQCQLFSSDMVELRQVGMFKGLLPKSGYITKIIKIHGCCSQTTVIACLTLRK